MQKTEKERIVADLAERLRSTESLIVADYRGLTNSQLVELRAKLRGSGARLQVVKNTLTRRAAEEAGAESLLALLEGPTAIAFVEAEGDPVAVAKALSDTARDTKVLALRGGILSGRSITGAEVEELAKLPAPDVIKSQLVGVIVAPLTQLAGLLTAPVRDLVGLIDARIEQLGDSAGDTADAESLEEPASASVEVPAVAATDAGNGEPDRPADSAQAESTPEANDGVNGEPDHPADSAQAESADEEE